MSRIRLVVGTVVMGIVVPLVLFFLLRLSTVTQFLSIAAVTFLSWGVADLLSIILERPRLQNRSPAAAIREDLERRAKDEA